MGMLREYALACHTVQDVWNHSWTYAIQTILYIFQISETSDNLILEVFQA